MNLPPLLQAALAVADQIKYPLVFLGALIQGPTMMIGAGLLLHSKVFAVPPFFIALMLGDLTGDVIWYHIGYYFAGPFTSKYGWLFSVSPELFEKAKVTLKHHHKWILFISKVTMGFGMALGTLMAAGAAHIKFSTYMLLNILGGLVFITSLLLFGYFFGQLYIYVADTLGVVFVVVSVAVASLLVYGFSKYMRDRVMQSK